MAKIPQLDLTRCWFPKYRGQLWTDVVKEDKHYIEWLVSIDSGIKLTDSQYDYLQNILENHGDGGDY